MSAAKRLTLFCEGSTDSIDGRLLRSLLKNSGIVVKPTGSKYGFESRIERERRTGQSVVGIRDRDFDNLTGLEKKQPSANTPVIWNEESIVSGEKIIYGWYWARKEIENYLVDPQVVSNAIGQQLDGFDLKAYKEQLQEAAQNLATYTAARMAISISRPKRPKPYRNYWGVEKADDYLFPNQLPETQKSCLTNIELIIKEHQQGDANKIQDAKNIFGDYLNQCEDWSRDLGIFLQYFAGKDILYSLENYFSTIKSRNQTLTPMLFRELVINGIEKTPQVPVPVWKWLPEWEALRNEIISYQNG